MGLQLALRLVILFLTSVCLGKGLDLNSKGNLVAYWGQNSFANSDSAASGQPERPLSDYCRDATYDVLVMSFLTKFNAEDPAGFPVLNLGEHCKGKYNSTDHPHCPEVAEGIKYCQSQGKVILLSMGGYAGDYTIATTEHAESLANRMWDLYFGGSTEHRPFGDAIIDGIDLDIEKGPPENYASFSNSIHAIFSNTTRNVSNRTYYVTAAPQCPFPDAHLKNTLEHGWLDMVFVQFYNNPCGLGSNEFNMATWDNWARNTSVNPNARIFIGAPASPSAANTGYLSHQQLEPVILESVEKYPSFGGVMLWDVSQANMNLCPEAQKLFSVAISHTLKGEYDVIQPGAAIPPSYLEKLTHKPDISQMIQAYLPGEKTNHTDPESPKNSTQISVPVPLPPSPKANITEISDSIQKSQESSNAQPTKTETSNSSSTDTKRGSALPPREGPVQSNTQNPTSDAATAYSATAQSRNAIPTHTTGNQQSATEATPHPSDKNNPPTASTTSEVRAKSMPSSSTKKEGSSSVYPTSPPPMVDSAAYSSPLKLSDLNSTEAPEQ